MKVAIIEGQDVKKNEESCYEKDRRGRNEYRKD